MIRPVSVNTCRRLTLALACLLLAACSVRSIRDEADSGTAVGTPQPAASSVSASKDREKAIVSYRDYLARYPGAAEHDSISRRLADLLVEQAADMQLAAATARGDSAALQATAQQSYREAIGYYEYLLDKYPSAADTTDLLYQLSRAYAESGASQQALMTIDRLLLQSPHSNVRLYADTRFRRGELLFGEGAFMEAGESYQAVVDLGESVPAYEQALYKLGWSLFRQERYTDALPVLCTFLDMNIPAGDFAVQQAVLSPADREQTADVFHVISMSFAQLDGVNSIEPFFSRYGRRGYEDHIYLDLAGFYTRQEQVNEAAGTLQALAQRHPHAAEAPRLSERALNLYRQAGFQQRVLESETLFVRDYGLGTDFWTQHSPADFPDVLQELQSSLQALAHYYHAQARSTQDATAVRLAEQWYREYLTWFADEAGAADMNFQLAELLYENGRYRQAVDAYEQAAWSRGTHPHAADAALGSLRASEKLLQDDTVTDQRAVDERALASARRFAMSYPKHAAAPGLLAKTGTTLLEQQQYDAALQMSAAVLADSVSVPVALRQAAWSIQAQAYYQLGNYALAASAYREALALATEDDPRRPALQQGLATSTYKLAEQTAAQGDKRAAVLLYQQAAQLAPEASLRSKAQYDAATALLAQQLWSDTIVMLEQYRRDYPKDPLQGEVTRKLAYARDQSGQYSQAAAEYLRLGQDRQQADALQREALLRAADLFEQTAAVAQANSTRSLYLERFPQPLPAAVDVMQQLADVEGNSGHAGKRQHWLEAIIRVDRADGTAQTRVIAAQAALELAEKQLAGFKNIQLVNPVQQQLARKLQAMQQALQAFETVIDYGVVPVATAATYHIASMYDELGQALLTSERPVSLTAEELAEYEVLLTEQAAPFEQQAIEIYKTNARRSAGKQRDPWVEKSVQRLAELQGSP